MASTRGKVTKTQAKMADCVYDCPAHVTVNKVNFFAPYDNLEVVPGSMKRTATGLKWKMRQKAKVKNGRS